ncbi:hypothetical protein CY652_13830 [Burkholderia sp. WAC0059]|uniref:hypothetical protein n=1 Tax=Burkholderia sp. WAC0059 TaxID=2066022 RepID=UPI000C7F2A29|nr:hypothetical protein [Burkholderia sp. WAC0059]PLZ01757.1 hypothetical protein CY652_13830 [Burkholderia sp. WAC0059]
MATTSIPALAVTKEELDRDPEKILRLAERACVTIYSEGIAVACLVPIEEWHELVHSLGAQDRHVDALPPDVPGIHS